uniref:GNAT family N-acetyltransferase n=1 Tax=uncultured Sphingomonas sp. TaxID=158754 RepID=UPI0035CB52F8
MTDTAAFDLLTTRSGVPLRVRPADAADEAALAEFFTHVSPDDLRFRFLSGADTVRRDQLVAMTQVDHGRTESFLAYDAADDRLVATAMLACDPALRTGEVAIVVRSDYKNKGLGWALLDYVAAFAEPKGLHAIEAVESWENRAALEVERDMGFTIASYPGDATLSLVRRLLPAGIAAGVA